MKKFLVISLTVLLVLAVLAGCADTAPKESPTVKPAELTRGTVDGSVYSCEYTGITFTAPEGWQYASDEEIAEITGLATDMLSEAGMEFSKEQLEQKAIYDIMAQNPLTGTNLFVIYENLSLTAGGTKYDETMYLDLLVSQLKQAGIYNYEFGEETDATISGNQYKLLTAAVSDMGFTQYYYIRKIDKYMFLIAVTVADGDDISDVMDCFS